MSEDTREREWELYTLVFTILGAMATMVSSGLGAAYGMANSGTGIMAMSDVWPEPIMKSIIPVVMAGIITIYGLVAAVPTASSLNDDISLYSGFLQLSAGLSGLAAGFAIIVVGDTGKWGTVLILSTKQPLSKPTSHRRRCKEHPSSFRNKQPDTPVLGSWPSGVGLLSVRCPGARRLLARPCPLLPHAVDT
uniref:V-type proton ATPase proteolipid subunit n=1 Tax=Theropithecus gelada TaxID=9565 RepID=A0A8D2FRW0_THEGE